MLLLFPILAMLGADPAQPVVAADTIVHHAKIWTGNPEQPNAEAVAILRGRFLAVGSNEQILPLRGPTTRMIHAEGRRVIPGLHDSHAHFLGGGLQLARVELKDAATPQEWARRLKEFHEQIPRDRWLLGGNWDHDRAFAGTLPNAKMLDRLVGDRPAYLRRYDGHMALANSAALKLAGITANTPNPAGGVIDRLDDGKTPSGILRDNAMALLEKVVPEPSDDEIREAIQAAMKAAAAVGITSIQDMEGSPPAVRAKLIRALHKLAEADKLDVRINLHWPIALQKQLADVGIAANFGNDFLRLGGVKGYMDGSLGSSTAKMFDPYASDKTTTGVFVTEPDAMRALVRSATDSGLLVAIHAIGDRANAEVLTIFEDLAARPGAGRFRIEHVQHLRVEDYPRFKKANVVASMQPYHIVDDGRWAEGRIGTKRCASSYAYRSLLDQGTRLAFGSDWPVAPLNPFLGIEAAVLRQTLDGKNPRGWFPEQAITVEEALKAYTTGSAYAAGQELERGLIKPGFLGDLVILQQDILDPNLRGKLGSILPKMTLLGGRVVSESKD